MLAGAALQDGRLTSLDQPLAEGTTITLRHALSNTTGLRWPGPGQALPATLSAALPAALSLPAEAASGGFPEQLPYGLGWWIGDGFAMASGFGGQMIALLPRQQTVISVLSAMDRPHPENRQLLAAALAEASSL